MVRLIKSRRVAGQTSRLFVGKGAARKVVRKRKGQKPRYTGHLKLTRGGFPRGH